MFGKEQMVQFLTTRELAAMLRVKERKVYELAAKGALPVRRLTGKLLFPRDEIEEWRFGLWLFPKPTVSLARPTSFKCACGGAQASSNRSVFRHSGRLR
jgi:excisionase family DNA binding protein